MLHAMSDSRAALFQAVLDRPAEDAPRFAYAAYCDAHGDPYGAFIRAQLARTDALRHGSEEDASRYGEEARLLEGQHRSPAWTNGVEALARLVTFVRGFVESVVVEGERYLDIADALYQRAPVRHLVLSEVGDRVIDIARDPHLAQLASLTLANTSGKRPIGDAGLAAIAASPHLRDLRTLEVARQKISRGGLEALCMSKSLPSLVYVNLVGNQFEDPREGYGTDWATGRIVPEGTYLSSFGRELEARYGDLPWLHAPSRLRHFPPLEDEL
jgi:uncharacterized protein (TIGR02996 family)